ncbi:class A beta-lactamase [Sediminibacillus halophilus]|uniref:Beta-lactamase n=1 Tax=Sediminibacillus halophilus TaxID=482461 RepID=A0A1G9TAA4_9BACI|nr:class A beta-lactamase [Sediminibacillus halophilus]SDM44564.1 beta-lactamase class A [Sediminibacillus halophilus]
MRKTTRNKFKMMKFTLYIALLCVAMLCIAMLAACSNAENKTDASPNEKKKSEKTIDLDEEFSQIEEAFDARLGVYAIDTGTNQSVKYNPDERFAYSSTFKLLASAFLLKQNDLKDLEKVVTFGKDDLVTYSPVTEKHVDTGMTLLEISEAAIRKSDNTAGNLLLNALGGPENYKQALREIGDDVTQPERYETELNEFSPGNKRDTSTPRALANNLRKVVLGDFLPREKQELLIDWMKGNATGDALIRAGKPEGWTVGDKSGAGSYGTRNDIAIVWPPGREPIVIAVMSRHKKKDAKYDDELVARAAEVTLNAFK